MSRTSRFLKGFGVGYAGLAVTTVAGLFLTRFYLHHLGQVDFGYWLVASQLLGFAALLDLGVVALLPREIAFATGATSRAAGHDDVLSVLERVSGLVILQTPLVSLILLFGWALLPSEWAPIRWPLALLLASFVLSFPMRIPTAVLTGLQDLGFLSWIQLTCWCAGTVVTVLLVLAGWRLGSLAAGYIATQVLTTIWALWRVRQKWPGLIPRRIVWPRRDSIGYVKSAGWATTSQIAQLFILGTEGVIVGSLFGPASVVPYSMTGKLFSVLGNQPSLVMQAAAPGLSEARTATDGPTRLGISAALGQGMLILTATIVLVIVTINQGFVSWWLGPGQYAGLFLTALFGLRLFLRQWNTTLVYTLFSFGHERRIALIALADGLLTVLLSIFFARQYGLIGVPLGSILAVLITSLPLNVAGIQHDTGVPFFRIVGAQLWWQWRVAILAVLACAASIHGNEMGLGLLLIKTTLALTTCLLFLGPLLLRPPLGSYVRPRLNVILSRLGFAPTGSS